MLLAGPGGLAHIAEVMTATILVNGEARVLDEPLSLSALVERLGLDTRKVAIECNAAIVPRSLYAQTWLAAGDQLEIVHFIGGG